MYLSSTFYELHYYVFNFMYNNQFLANFATELAFFNEHVQLDSLNLEVTGYHSWRNSIE